MGGSVAALLAVARKLTPAVSELLRAAFDLTSTLLCPAHAWTAADLETAEFDADGF
jgi:hypothetical protein